MLNLVLCESWEKEVKRQEIVLSVCIGALIDISFLLSSSKASFFALGGLFFLQSVSHFHLHLADSTAQPAS